MTTLGYPPRIVFFGLDGAFSRIPLETLSKAGLSPALVIAGHEPPPGQNPRTTRWAAQPNFWSRWRAPQARGPADLAHAAHTLGIDAIRTHDANRADLVRELTRLAPDILVVAGFNHLLSAELIQLPRLGGLNIHPGRLPQERGAAPLFWALKAGRTQLGWTIHLLDKGEDSGDIIYQGEIETLPGTPGTEILSQLALAAAPFLLRAVRDLSSGQIIRFPQNHNNAGRYRRPKFRDGAIDPSRPAHEVYTFVAACAPTYSLFVEVAGDRFFIQNAQSYDPTAHMDYDYVLTGDRLLLRCNPGVVELTLREEGALFSAEH